MSPPRTRGWIIRAPGFFGQALRRNHAVEFQAEHSAQAWAGRSAAFMPLPRGSLFDVRTVLDRQTTKRRKRRAPLASRLFSTALFRLSKKLFRQDRGCVLLDQPPHLASEVAQTSLSAGSRGIRAPSSRLAAGCRQNPQAGCLRYDRALPFDSTVPAGGQAAFARPRRNSRQKLPRRAVPGPASGGQCPTSGQSVYTLGQYGDTFGRYGDTGVQHCPAGGQ